jgi:hypothetical protein
MQVDVDLMNDRASAERRRAVKTWTGALILLLGVSPAMAASPPALCSAQVGLGLLRELGTIYAASTDNFTGDRAFLQHSELVLEQFKMQLQACDCPGSLKAVETLSQQADAIQKASTAEDWRAGQVGKVMASLPVHIGRCYQLFDAASDEVDDAVAVDGRRGRVSPAVPMANVGFAKATPRLQGPPSTADRRPLY